MIEPTGKYLDLKIDPYLVYPGAKWSMAKWIISFFPEHRIYLEPFAGSAAVFFNKTAADIEKLNDVNGDIVNLFRVMREQLEELIFSIEATPWSREEFDQSFMREKLAPVERARRFLVHCWQSHKPKLGHRTGWKKESTGRARKNYTRQWSNLPDRLRIAAERLLMAQIENRSAFDVIAQHKNSDVLIYADPPYILSTRTGDLYAQEMNMHEHRMLLALLLAHPGPVIVSGLKHDLYDCMLKGWRRESKMVNTCSGRANEEMLWINEIAADRLDK